MVSDTSTSLSSGELQELHRVAGILIPASEEHAVPGANDPVIFADIVKSLGRDLAHVRAALAGLEGKHSEAVIRGMQAPCSDAALPLGRAILQCYCRDDRVMFSLGIEAGAPFPTGHAQEQGNW